MKGTTKLTAYQAIAVCELAHKVNDDFTIDEIAALFGIHPTTVKQIRNGRLWFEKTMEVRARYQKTTTTLDN